MAASFASNEIAHDFGHDAEHFIQFLGVSEGGEDFELVIAQSEQGADADVVVWDPNRKTTIGIHDKHHMNMDYSAWEGYEIDGHVDTVISRGKIVIDDNAYLGTKGDGRYIKRGLSQYLI